MSSNRISINGEALAYEGIDETPRLTLPDGRTPRMVLATEELPGRVHEVVDPVALLPSSSMPHVAATLAMRIHPDAAVEIESIFRGHEKR